MSFLVHLLHLLNNLVFQQQFHQFYCYDITFLDQENNIVSFGYDNFTDSYFPAVQGCMDDNACNYDNEATTQLYDLSLCEYDCSESPEEFSFNQSSFQAFYFVLSGTDLYGDPSLIGPGGA